MDVRGMEPTATVAVAGGKGGSGKTTATLGIATRLAARGRRPLAVDADVDLPDLHIRAGVPVEPGLTSPRPADPVAASRESPRFAGVDVLPAGAGDRTVGPTLSLVASLDRPVLLDCPAGAGPDAAAPLRHADASVLVHSDRTASRVDARKTARMARALDAPTVARLERARDAGARSEPPDAATRVRIPTVDRRPLARQAVLDAFERATATVYEGRRR
jgi:septum site-determining protein MinD